MPREESAPALEPYDIVAEAYAPVRDEVEAELPTVAGRFPDALDGVLFRNGPGALEMGADRYRHPFDGDGMILRFDIAGGRVRYRNRYVATRERVHELRAGRSLYRGFGTNLPGGFVRNALRLRFKNAANTSVQWHGGRLLALWEGGLPHALDPATLETRGRFDFDGALRPPRWALLDRLLAPELPFSAHPKIDPRTGDLFNFGTLVGARNRLVIHRIDRRGVFREKRWLNLDALPFVHDFVLTERHFVFFLPPVEFDVPRALLGLKSPVEALRQAPGSPTRVLVVPRDGGPVRTFEARAGFVFHFANGFERGHRLVIDGARMPRYDGGTIDIRDPSSLRNRTLFEAVPTRYEVDLVSGLVTESQLSDTQVELPTIDPRRVGDEHTQIYAIARSPGSKSPLHGAIARLVPETGMVVLRSFEPDLPSEPIFVPRAPDAPEGEGYLLAVIYRAHARRSDLVCLDATTLDEVAVAALPHAIPPGFHGCFVRRGGLSGAC